MSIPKPIRKKRYLAAAGAAIAGVSLFTALPSAADPDLQSQFTKLDVNGDGVLSNAEFIAPKLDGAKQMELRALKQGGPAPAEPGKSYIFVLPADDAAKVAEAWRDVSHRRTGADTRPAMIDSRKKDFPNYDANGDAKIDLPEFLARQKAMIANGFTRLDADRNGSLDAKEYAAIGADFLITPPDTDLSFGVMAKYGPLARAETIEANFTKLDANKDGALSLAEYLPQT